MSNATNPASTSGRSVTFPDVSASRHAPSSTHNRSSDPSGMIEDSDAAPVTPKSGHASGMDTDGGETDTTQKPGPSQSVTILGPPIELDSASEEDAPKTPDNRWTEVGKRGKPLTKPPTVKASRKGDAHVVGGVGVTIIATPAVKAKIGKRKEREAKTPAPEGQPTDATTTPASKRAKKTKTVITTAIVPVAPPKPVSSTSTFPFSAAVKGKGRADATVTAPTDPNAPPAPPAPAPGSMQWTLEGAAARESEEAKKNAAKQARDTAGEAKRAKKEAEAEFEKSLLERFDATWGASAVQTDTVTVELAPSAIPRCTPPGTMNAGLPRDFKLHLMKHDLANGDGAWLMVQVYNRRVPRDSDRTLLRMGIERLAEMAAGPNIKAEDYHVHDLVPGSSSIYVTASSFAAADRFAFANQFTVRAGAKGATFFIQHPAEWGSAVIFDVKNAPAKWADVQPHVAALVQDVAVRKPTSTSTTVFPRSLIYHQVKKDDVNGTTWRVAFDYEPARIAATSWKIPKSLGTHKGKGDMRVSEAPFCTKCISYSHTVPECPWWSVGPVIGRKHAPPSWKEVKWSHVASYDVMAIDVEEEVTDDDMPTASGSGAAASGAA